MRSPSSRFVVLLLLLAIPVSARADGLHDLVRAYIAAHTVDEAAAHAGIPSFTRQTGLACNVCHTAFPQLTQFGRLFKLNGYTLTGLQNVEAGAEGQRQSLRIGLIPPVSAMVQTSFTQTSKAQPDAQNGTVELPQELSLFLGEAITPRIGTFLQFTYEPAEGHLAVDNLDIRYANQATLGHTSVIYGVTVNNNPTVQDVWNTVPAWGYPYSASGVAPTPAAATLIDGGLGQQVAGIGTYALWGNRLYTEFSVYRSAPQGVALPADATAENTLRGIAPYWRAMLQHSWGSNYLAVGTYGMRTSLFPAGVTGLTDRRLDVALDAQYEHGTTGATFTAHATWIHERQALDATFDAGGSNATNTLRTFRADGGFYTAKRMGATLAYFSTTGSQDPLLYAPGPLSGSATGSPNSSGIITELNAMPWLNVRFAAQYVMYQKFNGAGNNYDGFGRNAADNNTLYLLTWLAF
jgi:hypothetical protein